LLPEPELEATLLELGLEADDEAIEEEPPTEEEEGAAELPELLPEPEEAEPEPEPDEADDEPEAGREPELEAADEEPVGDWLMLLREFMAAIAAALARSSSVASFLCM